MPRKVTIYTIDIRTAGAGVAAADDDDDGCHYGLLVLVATEQG